MEKLDVKKLTVEELNAELAQAEALSQDLRYNNSVAALEKSHELKFARKAVARIKTELRARELSQEGAGQNRDRIRARRKRQK